MSIISTLLLSCLLLLVAGLHLIEIICQICMCDQRLCHCGSDATALAKAGCRCWYRDIHVLLLLRRRCCRRICASCRAWWGLLGLWSWLHSAGANSCPRAETCKLASDSLLRLYTTEPRLGRATRLLCCLLCTVRRWCSCAVPSALHSEGPVPVKPHQE